MIQKNKKKVTLPTLDDEYKVIEIIEKGRRYFIYPSFGKKYVTSTEKLIYRELNVEF